MNCLSWNCRGLGNPRTVRQLQDLVSRFKPDIVFLMEVEKNMEKMERIKVRLKFEGIFLVEGKNRGGGIAMLWKDKGIARLLGFSRNHLDVEVQSPNLPKWRFTGFYGHPERHRRRESRQLLKSLKKKSNLPWCCIGDFNDLLAQTEKRGMFSHPHSLIRGFRDAVEESELEEVRMCSYQFTWELLFFTNMNPTLV